MRISIENAKLKQVDELMKLYSMVYGQNYPIAYGRDPIAAAEAINSPEFQWLVARDQTRGKIVGSIIFEIDRLQKVGKVLGVVVHPDYRSAGIASRLTARGNKLISAKGPLNSLYATTRTESIAPQLLFLKKGYLPLGIFPNSHKIKRFETTTLLAKFKAGVLERRAVTERIPRSLLRLYEVVRRTYPALDLPESDILPKEAIKNGSRTNITFEPVMAPYYVLRRFKQQVTDPSEQFYPFHTPNLLLAETSGEVELFAYYNQQDGYCTFISCNQPMYALHEKFPSLLETLRLLGISYVEVLISADRCESIEVLLQAQFLPSALYPAMREEDGRTYDYVVMTRTMEPLDFSGMAIEKSFKPFVDQYVALWKKMHLEGLEVFDEYN